MIDELKQNVETEIEILREISNAVRRLDYANTSERKLLLASIVSLKSSMKLINNSIPKLVENISAVQKLPQNDKVMPFEKVEFRSIDSTIHVTIDSKDRNKLLHELSISDTLIRKMKKRSIIPSEKFEVFKSARGYLKLSNRFFLDYASDLIDKGYFKSLSTQIKKANIDILFATYVAMILLTTVISFIVTVFVSLTLIIVFGFSSNLIAIVVLGCVGIPVLTFFGLYFYPSTEKDSLAKKIDRELPFAVIHMSAISGSGIEPVALFKIIGMNKEYPYLKKEIRKILNQINLYGYDLVAALNNVSKNTPSSMLAELFSGLSTTITSGSNLQTFFEKRAESLLITYRLEREKYSKVAETFMDIYISVVIAAPMILMILLVMISVMGMTSTFTLGQLTVIMLSVIILINAVFIGVMHLKQPNY